MDWELGKIKFVHIHAVEETIRYIEKHANATYEDVVSHISWYWRDGKPKDYKPQAWVFEWIRCLTG